MTAGLEVYTPELNEDIFWHFLVPLRLAFYYADITV